VANYNHTTPIARLFWRFEECCDATVVNGSVFTDAQLLKKFIMLMELTKVYKDAVTTWNKKPNVHKTWVNIKTDWLNEYLQEENLPVRNDGPSISRE